MTAPDDHGIGDGLDDARSDGDGYDDGDEWHVDPDAPQGVKATLDVMGADLRKLTSSSLIATVGIAVALAIAEAAAGKGFNLTSGFVVGGVLATANLWVLAGGYFAIVDQRATNARVVLATVGSLALLLAVAMWIVMFQQAWTVGFGLGLAVPAVGGLVYALRKPR